MTNTTNICVDGVSVEDVSVEAAGIVHIPDAFAAPRRGDRVARGAMAGANASKRLLRPRGATTG